MIQELGIASFIDDDTDCLESVFSDPEGNARDTIVAGVGKLVHFDCDRTGGEHVMSVGSLDQPLR